MNFDFLQACRQLISFDSSPQSSTKESVLYLADLAKRFGLHVDVQNEIQNGVEQANIIIRIRPLKQGEQEFLLQAHLDTIDPGAFSFWKKNSFNPFDAVIQDDKIYGLGAAEVKLDFLCKLQILIDCKDQDFKNLNPVLVGTFGEETGMQGALRLIRKNKINAKYALIGEPSNLQIINAAKGFATVEIRIPISTEEQRYKSQKLASESTSTQTKIFSGKSAHSSTPHLGESAAIKLLEYIAKMPENVVIVEMDAGTRFNTIPNQAMVELDVATSSHQSTLNKVNQIYQSIIAVEEKMKEVIDDQFQPEHSTLTIGIIRSFSDHILIGGSCRILPNVAQEKYEVWMKHIEQKCQELGAEFKLIDYKRPFRTNENSVFVKAVQNELKKLGLDPQCRSLASTNEASLFSRLGIECICLGAGEREGNVHTPTEHVRISDLKNVSIIYKNMLERFCL